jgi:hypothetical protein
MEAVHARVRYSSRKLRNTMLIKTTIYELMEAVIEVADPKENKLIEEVALNLGCSFQKISSLRAFHAVRKLCTKSLSTGNGDTHRDFSG